ncbi:MAG TPA: hypothetical protein VFN21_02795 [Acidimicrobiales bacterium]|nr:hypothetical protein [Acidimicrobiales bacterium]
MAVEESSDDSDERTEGPMPAGTRVEVRNAFDRTWSRGFVVTAHAEGRYRLLRRSDDTDLPGTFAADDVRRERRRSTWWV